MGKSRRVVFCLEIHMDIQAVRRTLKDLDECIEKKSPYRKLLLFKKNSDITYLITDKDIMLGCADKDLAPYLFWAVQEGFESLLSNKSAYTFEGDAALFNADLDGDAPVLAHPN